jgi:hypothetical protein
MAVDTIAGLKAKMPLAQAAQTSVQDLHDLIDTLEDRTTQGIVSTSVGYGVLVTDNRRKILSNAGGGITITLPNTTPVGFELTVVQMAAGSVAIQVTGGVLLSRENHTRTAGQYAVAFLFCASNSGSAPQIILTGDTAP